MNTSVNEYIMLLLIFLFGSLPPIWAGESQLFLGDLHDASFQDPKCSPPWNYFKSCQRGTLNVNALKDGEDLLFPNGKLPDMRKRRVTVSCL